MDDRQLLWRRQSTFATRHWSRSVNSIPRHTTVTPAAPTCGSVDINQVVCVPGDMAADLRTEQSCGMLRLAGTGSVDGVHAVRLTGTSGGISETYWVDTSTYLPPRITTVWLGTNGPVQQDDLRWLPPTEANLANLTVPIPAGFRQIPPPKA
jgi:hypothetical protein